MQTLFEWLLIPISLAILLLVLAAPLIVVYLFFRLSTEAFYQVGFSYWHALLMVFGSFLGSAVDFPSTPGSSPSTPYLSRPHPSYPRLWTSPSPPPSTRLSWR